MNIRLIRLSALGVLALALAACTPTRTTVRPMETVQDTVALEAGELRIAASALQSGDLGVARSLYQELSRSHPDQPAVWMGLGNTHFLGSDYEAARAAYARAAALEPEALEPQLAQARVDIRVRRLDEARQRYQALLAQRPDDPVVLAGLGVVYDLSGQFDLAQQTYRKGLAQHAEDEVLRTNLGLSLALSGHEREAINVLLGHDGVNDALPQRRDNLALAYGLMGRDDAAESILMTYQPRGQVQDNLEFYRYVREHLK